MNNRLEYLSIYIVIILSISGFYYNITSEYKEQLKTTHNELNGVEYLKSLYHLSIHLISYKNIKADESSLSLTRKTLYFDIKQHFLLQKKYPEFKNSKLNKQLNIARLDGMNIGEFYELLDYVNHENYRVGDISSILFDSDRKINFLGSLLTHYLPEYMISANIRHNIVKKFYKSDHINNYEKNLYTQQSKLVELSSSEINEIITLLNPYKDTKKLLFLINEIKKELVILSKYDDFVENWQTNNRLLENYIATSKQILKLSHRLNNENIHILKSSLTERKIFLEEKILIHRFFVILTIIFITMIIFYYYRAVEALKKEKQKTQDALEFKSKFLSNMSHEIRTPLNGIIGLTHVVDKTDLNAKQKDLISKIKYTSDLLLNVINDILDISKIESGKMSIEKVPLNLIELAENLHGIFSIQAQEKNINFKVDYKHLETPYLLGDFLRISQVLTNLLSNAVKFTSSGGVTLKIQTRDNSIVRFSIQDSGIGLKPEQIEILFQEFTQADMSTSRKYGGTGLGLSIVKNLVELMGGRIWIESKYGVSSTFIFEIPLA